MRQVFSTLHRRECKGKDYRMNDETKKLLRHKDIGILESYWVVEIVLPNWDFWIFHCIRNSEEEANKAKEEHDERWGAGGAADKEFRSGGCKSRIVECLRKVKA